LHMPVSVVACVMYFSWLVVAACLPCLAINMLHGKGSL
jgi:hypothetical protein